VDPAHEVSFLPDVSVCIPAYNAERFIGRAIESVLAQSHRSWELIIVDDCSTDGTRVVVQSVQQRVDDPRITLHANPTRLGMGSNWNRALTMASGRFVKLLCHDDVLEEDCLEAQVAAMEKHPSVTLVTCARRIISANGTFLFVRRGFSRSGVYPGRQIVARTMSSGTNPIGEPCAVLIRRETLNKTGPYREDLHYYIDLDLWLRVLSQGDMYFIAAPKASFRMHPGSVTRKITRREMYAEYFRVMERACRETGTRMSPLRRLAVAMKMRFLRMLRVGVYTYLENR
jgi:glycosyltransferase involved in cell wall biosynthesis